MLLAAIIGWMATMMMAEGEKEENVHLMEVERWQRHWGVKGMVMTMQRGREDSIFPIAEQHNINGMSKEPILPQQ